MTSAPLTSVLIVDDNRNNLAVVFDHLSSAGYRVLTAQSGETALEVFSQSRPDLVLLDVMMPGLDGFETCQRIHQIPDCSAVPVIFMTALDDPESKVQAFASGGVDYVTKPFQEQELLARVSTHISLAAMRRKLEEGIASRDEAIAELDAFSHAVAHDLRNPLAGATGLAESLAGFGDEMPPEERSELHTLILNSCQHARAILDSLLLLHGLRKHPPKIEVVDPGAALDAARERVSQRLDMPLDDLVVRGALPNCLGVEDWVTEVWTVFLHNAYTHGGRDARVEVSATSSGGCVCFHVDDSGPGVDPRMANSLFRPFTSIKDARTKGNGLGMPVVQRILEVLGGTGSFGKSPLGGARFSFNLPAAGQ